MSSATVKLRDRVGDAVGWIGPCIGETVGQTPLYRTVRPAARGGPQPPATMAITGKPGGGKDHVGHAADIPAGAGECEHVGSGQQFAGQRDDLAPQLILGEAH
jgi:hypothetical protein